MFVKIGRVHKIRWKGIRHGRLCGNLDHVMLVLGWGEGWIMVTVR